MVISRCTMNYAALCKSLAAAIACKRVQDDEPSTSEHDDIPLETKLGISVRVGVAPPKKYLPSPPPSPPPPLYPSSPASPSAMLTWASFQLTHNMHSQRFSG